MIQISKSPNSDDVFAKFIEKTPAKELEKLFGVKGVKFEKSNISAAESVQNIVKSALFFFRSEFSSEEAKKNFQEKEVNSKNLNKIKFFVFPKSVNQIEWKSKTTIPKFESISKINCKKCGGKGYLSCKTCEGSGLIPCKTCKGSGMAECKVCKGTGKKVLEFEVTIGDTNKKEKRSIDEQCGECLGSGKIACKSCGGVGKYKCNKCKGNFGKEPCKDCGGSGNNYKYKIEPVPFITPKSQYVPYLFFKPEFEKKLGEELSSIITTVDGIYIKSLKDMDENSIKAQLGYWDGDIRSRMNDAKVTFAKLEKSKGPETPKFPIYLFPVSKLEIKPPKGKIFNVYSIGTERGYTVFSPDF